MFKIFKLFSLVGKAKKLVKENEDKIEKGKQIYGQLQEALPVAEEYIGKAKELLAKIER